MRALLKIRPRTGEPFQVEIGNTATIGRSRDNAVCLAMSPHVSRQHAIIRCHNAFQYQIMDLGSRNGVFVNGQRVEDTAKLKVGDRIQIGSTVFVLETATNQEDAQKALGNVQNEMADGKGYTTILKEIVEDIAPAAPEAAPAEKPAPKPSAGRPAIQIKHPSIKIAAKPEAEAAPEEKAAPGKVRISIKK